MVSTNYVGTIVRTVHVTVTCAACSGFDEDKRRLAPKVYRRPAKTAAMRFWLASDLHNRGAA
jgi:hypothetical protein